MNSIVSPVALKFFGWWLVYIATTLLIVFVLRKSVEYINTKKWAGTLPVFIAFLYFYAGTFLLTITPSVLLFITGFSLQKDHTFIGCITNVVCAVLGIYICRQCCRIVSPKLS